MKLRMYLIFALCSIFTALQGQWTAIDSISSGGLHSINFINADTGFAFNEPGVLRKTVDGGMTWDSVQIPFSGYINDIDFYNDTVGYAVGGAWFPFANYYAYSIMKTSDGGVSWDSVHATSMAGVFDHVEAISADEFYATGRRLVMHSDDGGATLDTVYPSSLLPQGAEDFGRVQFISPTKGYILGNAAYFGGVYWMTLYETQDGGQSWQAIYSDSITRIRPDFRMSSSGKGIIVARKNEIIQTQDGGATWQNIAKPDTNVIFSKLEGWGEHLYALAQNNADTTSRLLYSPDWGSSWQNQLVQNANQSGLGDLSIPTEHTGYVITWLEIFKNEQLIGAWEFETGSFNYYPNPTGNRLFLEFKDVQDRSIRLLNISGQQVTTAVQSEQKRFSLNLEGISNGIYFLVVHQEGGSLVEKIVKQ